MHQNDEKVKEVLSKTRGHPRRRLQYIYDLAKVKSLCEGGDKMEKKFDPLAERGEDPTQAVSSYPRVLLKLFLYQKKRYVYSVCMCTE